MKQIEEIMKEFDAEFYESHNWEEVNDHIEEALLSARTELIKEIRDKMPKKKDCEVMHVKVNGTLKIHSWNECLSEFESILNNLK